MLEGTNNTDTYLNFSKPKVVSENEESPTPYIDHPTGYRDAQTYNSYRVIPIESGKSYLFVGYGFYEDEPKSLYVAGYDGLVNSKMDHGVQEQDMPTIPVTEWDGRMIEYNKSGKHKFTKSKKEILDVNTSIVAYSNGVVTEVPGVKVGSVKINKKALKSASVALDYSVVENKGVVAYPVSNDWVAKPRLEAYGDTGDYRSVDIFVNEYAALGKTMPSFTMTLKLKGAEAKAYKKDVDKLLKDKAQTFFFGVQQSCVKVRSFNYGLLDYFYDNVTFTEDPETGVKTYTISPDNIEKALGERLSNEAYEKYRIDCDESLFSAAKFNIRNFREKEGKATIKALGYVGKDLKDGTRNDTLAELSTLKPGKDYRFVDGSLAGSRVKVLEFVDNGNYTYKPIDHEMVGIDHGPDGMPNYTYTLSDVFYKEEDWERNISRGDMAQLGFKWAFRQSPIDSKLVRYGVYKDTNVGFSYSLE